MRSARLIQEWWLFLTSLSVQDCPVCSIIQQGWRLPWDRQSSAIPPCSIRIRRSFHMNWTVLHVRLILPRRSAACPSAMPSRLEIFLFAAALWKSVCNLLFPYRYLQSSLNPCISSKPIPQETLLFLLSYELNWLIRSRPRIALRYLANALLYLQEYNRNLYNPPPHW